MATYRISWVVYQSCTVGKHVSAVEIEWHQRRVRLTTEELAASSSDEDCFYTRSRTGRHEFVDLVTCGCSHPTLQAHRAQPRAAGSP